MEVKKYSVSVTMDGSWDTVEDPNGEFIKAEDFEAYAKQLNIDLISQAIDAHTDEVNGCPEVYEYTTEELQKAKEVLCNLSR